MPGFAPSCSESHTEESGLSLAEIAAVTGVGVETASVRSAVQEPDDATDSGAAPALGTMRPVHVAPSLAAPAGPMSAPEAWLVRIERLRASGQTEDAERQLEAFRKVYPDYRPARRATVSGAAPAVE